MSSVLAVWKEIHHHLECQCSHQASVMFTVKSCNMRSIFYCTRPEQPRPKSVRALEVSNTAPSVHGAISHGRPAEIRQEAEESSRGDSVSLDFYFRARQSNGQPGTATQGSRNSHELPRHCIEESRSLVNNNSVSYGSRHRTSTDTDQGPFYVQRDTAWGSGYTPSSLRTAPSPSITPR